MMYYKHSTIRCTTCIQPESYIQLYKSDDPNDNIICVYDVKENEYVEVGHDIRSINYLDLCSMLGKYSLHHAMSDTNERILLYLNNDFVSCMYDDFTIYIRNSE